MTTINKSKVTIINWGLTTIFIVICFLLSLIQIQEAYAEMKKVSATSKRVANLFSSKSSKMQATVRFVNTTSIYSSADPDWNNAPFSYIEYDESAKEWGDRGYGVITRPSGDQTFIKFMVRDISETAGIGSTGEWEGVFIGGTGKFKDIKARWLYKWKRTVTEGEVAEWEVEYF